MGAAGTARLADTGITETAGWSGAAGARVPREASHLRAVRPEPVRPEVVVPRARTGAPGRTEAPLRLTRRGRMLALALAVAVAAGIAALAWLTLAGGAQASGRGQSGPGAGRPGLTRVVVQPGQTLWSIASRAEPAADPRVVVQQIMEINSLSDAGIQVGRVLWVPRG